MLKYEDIKELEIGAGNKLDEYFELSSDNHFYKTNFGKKEYWTGSDKWKTLILSVNVLIIKNK
jgi:hypothetical protein